MNKFTERLSANNKEIKAERAKSLSSQVALEAETFVNDLKRDVFSLKNKIADLSDLAPEHTQSLRPASKDFNPKKWISDLHNAKLELAIAEEKLAAAIEIQTEWFNETAVADEQV